jgi:hypothetical protein
MRTSLRGDRSKVLAWSSPTASPRMDRSVRTVVDLVVRRGGDRADGVKDVPHRPY